MSYQRFCLRFHSLATEASNVSFRGCWVVPPTGGGEVARGRAPARGGALRWCSVAWSRVEVGLCVAPWPRARPAGHPPPCTAAVLPRPSQTAPAAWRRTQPLHRQRAPAVCKSSPKHTPHAAPGRQHAPAGLRGTAQAAGWLRPASEAGLPGFWFWEWPPFRQCSDRPPGGAVVPDGLLLVAILAAPWW